MALCDGVNLMPAKGTRKKNPKGKQLRKPVDLPVGLYDAIDRLGRANGIVNPRNGQGNRSQVIARLLKILPVFSKAKAIIKTGIKYLPEKERATARSVLLELEELEIGQACGKANGE